MIVTLTPSFELMFYNCIWDGVLSPDRFSAEWPSCSLTEE